MLSAPRYASEVEAKRYCVVETFMRNLRPEGSATPTAKLVERLTAEL
jgi:hypothetical protein